MMLQTTTNTTPNTMENRYQLVDVLNRQGVARMVEGDFASAIPMFQDGLDILETLRRASFSSPTTVVSSPWQFRTVSINRDQEDNSAQQTSFAIFGRCFLLEPSSSSSSLSSPPPSFYYNKTWQQHLPTIHPTVFQTDSNLFGIVLGYNLALAHHIMGNVTRAHHAYQRTIQVAHHLDVRNNARVRALALFVALAVANNMASLALTWLDVATFERYHALTGRLMLVTSTFHAPFFAQNLCFSWKVRERPAPAA